MRGEMTTGRRPSAAGTAREIVPNRTKAGLKCRGHVEFREAHVVFLPAQRARHAATAVSRAIATDLARSGDWRGSGGLPSSLRYFRCVAPPDSLKRERKSYDRPLRPMLRGHVTRTSPSPKHVSSHFRDRSDRMIGKPLRMTHRIVARASNHLGGMGTRFHNFFYTQRDRRDASVILRIQCTCIRPDDPLGRPTMTATPTAVHTRHAQPNDLRIYGFMV